MKTTILMSLLVLVTACGGGSGGGGSSTTTGTDVNPQTAPEYDATSDLRATMRGDLYARIWEKLHEKPRSVWNSTAVTREEKLRQGIEFGELIRRVSPGMGFFELNLLGKAFLKVKDENRKPVFKEIAKKIIKEMEK